MTSMKSRLGLGLALVGTLAAAMVSAQDTPRVAPKADEEHYDEQAIELLKQMDAAYQNIETLYLEGTQVYKGLPIPGIDELVVPVVIAIEAPDKVYSVKDHEMMGMTTVSNGETTSRYVVLMGQYTEVVGGISWMTELAQMGIPIEAGEFDMEALRKRASVVETLPEKSIDVGGDAYECPGVVLSKRDNNGALRIQLFFHPQLNIVLLAEAQVHRRAPGQSTDHVTEMSFTVSAFRVDEPMPADQFVFVAPEGAEKVDRFEMGGSRASPLEGKPAPDFSLEDLDGNQITLSSLQGKVVLLDFWASWCGPCKMELPHVDQLSQELKDQGLVVFGVNNEMPSRAQRYLDKSPLSFPTLVDRGSRVSGLYQITALPTTVIVGRDGNVVDYAVGFRSEAQLRAKLKEVGLQ